MSLWRYKKNVTNYRNSQMFQISTWGSSIFLSTAGLLPVRAVSSLVWIKNVGQTLKTRAIYPGDSQRTQISFCFRDRCSFFLPKPTQDLEINYMYHFTEATTWYALTATNRGFITKNFWVHCFIQLEQYLVLYKLMVIPLFYKGTSNTLGDLS